MTILTMDYDDYIEGRIGGVIFLFALVVFLIISITTNYVEVGIAGARTLTGFFCMIIVLINSIKCIFLKNKKEKIIGIIEILMITGLGIYGYNNQLYSSKMVILYSKFMSIFAKPLLIYILLMLVNIVLEKEEIGWHLVEIGLVFVVSVAICFTILVVFNFTHNQEALTWVGQNFRYYNQTMISRRINKYGADDIEVVLPVFLENSKNELLEKGYSLEEARDSILEYASAYSTQGYKLNDYYELSENIYVCDFYDKYQYNDDYEFPRYYVKIDFSSFTVLEFMEWYYEVSEETLEYVKNGLDYYGSALKYGVERCVNEGEELTRDNINNHIKEVDGASYFCYSIEDSENDATKYKVVMYRSSGDTHPTCICEVDKITYEVSYSYSY